MGGCPEKLSTPYRPYLGDGLKDFLFLTPKIGKMIPNLTIIFFKGVETTK